MRYSVFRFSTFAASCFALLAAVNYGCAVLLNAEDTQCSVDGDCAGLGFTGYICQDSVCSKQDTPDARPSIVNAVDGGPTGCQSTTQCTTDNGERAAICPIVGRPCVPLATDDCVVIGNYKDPNAIFWGEITDFTGSNDSALSKEISSQFEYAHHEAEVVLPESAIPGGPNGARRSIVLIRCESQGDPENWTRHADRLIGALDVSAVLATLGGAGHAAAASAAKLGKRPVVLTAGLGDGRRTSPPIADPSFILNAVEPVDGTVPAGVLKLADIERVVRAAPGFAGGDIRVELLTAADSSFSPAADAWTSRVTFNGKSAPANGSNWLHDTFPAAAGANPDHEAHAAKAVAFKPHVIIFAGSQHAASQLIPRIESSWPSASARPHYVAFRNVRTSDTLEMVGANSDLARRMLVLSHVYNYSNATRLAGFAARFKIAFPSSPYSGSPIYHDWFFQLMYATIAAGAPTNGQLRGDDILNGMEKINSGTRVPAGGDALQLGIQRIFEEGRIRLDGTDSEISQIDFAVGYHRADAWTYSCVRVENGAALFQSSGALLKSGSTAFEATPLNCPF